LTRPTRPRCRWWRSHAGIQLARIAAGCGAARAGRQYRQVLERSPTQQPRQAREIRFVALADSPATAALLGVAELADARGDTASADELRSRAGVAFT